LKLIIPNNYRTFAAVSKILQQQTKCK